MGSLTGFLIRQSTHFVELMPAPLQVGALCYSRILRINCTFTPRDDARESVKLPAHRRPRNSVRGYSKSPPQVQPSAGRVIFCIRIRWSATTRPGLPETVTLSPGLRVVDVMRSRARA